jgi:hypothetical protein
MSELTLFDNFILLLLSVLLFVYRLPVNMVDKICLFMAIFFPSAAVFLLIWGLGFDIKVMTLGRF